MLQDAAATDTQRKTLTAGCACGDILYQIGVNVISATVISVTVVKLMALLSKLFYIATPTFTPASTDIGSTFPANIVKFYGVFTAQ